MKMQGNGKKLAARRMLRSGKFSPEEVADFSGLPIEEVKKLQTTGQD